MPDFDPRNLGHLLEGTIEQDPMTDRFSLRTVDEVGRPVSVDLHELLGQYVGQDVRITLASLKNLQKLAELVEEAGGGSVMGIQPEDIPVPFNIARKPDEPV